MLLEKNNVGPNPDQNQIQTILWGQKTTKVVCLTIFLLFTSLSGLMSYEVYTENTSIDFIVYVPSLLRMGIFLIISLIVILIYIIISIVNYIKLKNKQADASSLRAQIMEIFLGISLVIIAIMSSILFLTLENITNIKYSEYSKWYNLPKVTQETISDTSDTSPTTSPETYPQNWQITDIDKNEKTFDADGLDSLVGVHSRFYIIDKTKITKNGEIVDFSTLKVGQKVRIETSTNHEPISIEISE